MIWLMLSSQAADAAVRWKPLCQEAYRQFRSGYPMDAWEKYNEALGTLGSDAPGSELALNIRLNMVTMELAAGQLDRARNALKDMEPRVCRSNFRNTLLAMRYWRRVCDLADNSRKFGDAVSAQEQVLRIARLNFESKSPFCLEEERKLMLWYERNGEIEKSARLASRLKKQINKLEASARDRFQISLNEFLSQALIDQMTLRDQGNIGKAKQVLDLCKDDFLKPIQYLTWLHELTGRAEHFKSPLTSGLQDEKLKLAKSLMPDLRAAEIYSDSLRYFVDVRGRNKTFDAQHTQLLRDRIAVEKMLLRSKTENESGGYIQLLCLLGMDLASQGKLAEAEKIADRIAPSPNHFSTNGIFDGIYQLRIHMLAERYLAAGDKAGIERQFRMLTDLYKRMKLIKDKEHMLKLWHGVELDYYKRFDARSLSRKVS